MAATKTVDDESVESYNDGGGEADAVNKEGVQAIPSSSSPMSSPTPPRVRRQPPAQPPRPPPPSAAILSGAVACADEGREEREIEVGN
uniref:Uncharacterized protein n=1 Tax=Oryza sativa subsp. japonica TaxID=39947 RepID=Q10HS3_ORYSJ|nr:hypothetical protein LOC_Os03g38090 [Oryza sativa Japonica Group]